MFGPRLTRVFASRNNALSWSVMVLITAYCAGAEPPAMLGAEAHVEEDGQRKDMEKSDDPWADMKNVAKKREKLLP